MADETTDEDVTGASGPEASPSEELDARNAEAAAEPSPSEELDARNAEAAKGPGAWEEMVKSNAEAAKEPAPSKKAAEVADPGSEQPGSPVQAAPPPAPAAPADKPAEGDAPKPYEYRLHPTPKLSDYDQPFHPTPKLSDYSPKLSSPDNLGPSPKLSSPANLNRVQPRDDVDGGDDPSPRFAAPRQHARHTPAAALHHVGRLRDTTRRLGALNLNRGRLWL